MTEKTKPFTSFKLNNKEKSIKSTKSIKSISLIKNINENISQDKKFLGIKRKLFKKISNKKEKKKKLLSITKASEYFINKPNFHNNDDDLCIICLDKITFQKRHFLHCGHCFHCYCINKWIKMDKDKCPLCKQNIECIESDSISLEEDQENNNDNIIINNYNSDLSGSYRFIKIYCIVVMILFIFKEFCFQNFMIY